MHVILARFAATTSKRDIGKELHRIDLRQFGGGMLLPDFIIITLLTHGDNKLNWDVIKGNWKQFTGKTKEKWGKLTDDDLATINGQREQLEGKIQERYGYGKDQVKKELDDWLATL